MRLPCASPHPESVLVALVKDRADHAILISIYLPGSSLVSAS